MPGMRRGDVGSPANGPSATRPKSARGNDVPVRSLPRRDSTGRRNHSLLRLQGPVSHRMLDGKRRVLGLWLLASRRDNPAATVYHDISRLGRQRAARSRPWLAPSRRKRSSRRRGACQRPRRRPAVGIHLACGKRARSGGWNADIRRHIAAGGSRRVDVPDTKPPAAAEKNCLSVDRRLSDRHACGRSRFVLLVDGVIAWLATR